MWRDFTFVEDLVAATVAITARFPEMGKPVVGESLSAVAPYRVLNIGGGRSTELMDFIASLERAMGIEARLNMMPMRPGDVVATEADTRLLQAIVGELPVTPLDEGINQCVAWFNQNAS